MGFVVTYALLPAADAIKLQTASKLQGQTILGKLQFSTNEIALFCDEIKLLFCDEMKLYQDGFTAVFSSIAWRALQRFSILSRTDEPGKTSFTINLNLIIITTTNMIDIYKVLAIYQSFFNLGHNYEMKDAFLSIINISSYVVINIPILIIIILIILIIIWGSAPLPISWAHI